MFYNQRGNSRGEADPPGIPGQCVKIPDALDELESGEST